MLADDAVTLIDANVAAVTVRTVEPVMPESAADMVVVPVATLVASPVPLPIVATEVLDELQVTDDVMV